MKQDRIIIVINNQQILDPPPNRHLYSAHVGQLRRQAWSESFDSQSHRGTRDPPFLHLSSPPSPLRVSPGFSASGHQREERD